MCGPCVCGSRHVGTGGYLGSVTAPPTKETFLTPFPGRKGPPQQAPTLPAVLNAQFLSFTTDSFPGYLNHWALSLAATTSHRRCKMLSEKEEPAIQVDCVVWGKIWTKDRFRALPPTFCCFETNSWQRLGLFQRLCPGAPPDLLNQSLHVHNNPEWLIRSL